jgi:hypothetical protein
MIQIPHIVLDLHIRDGHVTGHETLVSGGGAQDVILPAGAYLWLNTNDLPVPDGRGLLFLSPAGARLPEVVTLKRAAWDEYQASYESWRSTDGPIYWSRTGQEVTAAERSQLPPRDAPQVFDDQLRDAIGDLEARLNRAYRRLQRQAARVAEQLEILGQALR